MYAFLKHAHLTLILIALILFMLNFFWLQWGHKNAQKVIFKKILLCFNLAILVFGMALLWLLNIDPFVHSGFWMLEKMMAFVVYLFIVHVALDAQKSRYMQWLSFVGALAWLGYIMQLVTMKQAILLVG
ncbi:SirB2 family protein [Psychromonas sp. CD1]|uniref:SirB2 family protein n=1 Tax=Psychromonas sp. CD1 TaxID=1979839 RepID=UPI000B9C07CB|nr:SirB2 family protein [Psychromonas sp. CD1]